jgi:hypothetical protein
LGGTFFGGAFAAALAAGFFEGALAAGFEGVFLRAADFLAAAFGGFLGAGFAAATDRRAGAFALLRAGAEEARDVEVRVLGALFGGRATGLLSRNAARTGARERRRVAPPP